jgi:hypothetical protein
MKEPRRALAAPLVACLVLAGSAQALQAQTITDGIMMPRRNLCTGFLYDRDRWTNYWEGTLERDNLNIGTLTTHSVTWMGNYGITDRINLIGMVPHVRTEASAGTLRGQSGLQDLTLALKVNAFTAPLGPGSLKAIAVGSVAAPLSDYTPDFYPLSLGSASRRASGRLTLNYTSRGGLYVNGSGGYTWRDNVTLDRSTYYTDGHLFYTDQVSMPDVYDYTFSIGFSRGRTLVPISFSKMVTRGGSEIRRQDMPFVSNRMIASRLDASVLYYLPRLQDLGLRLAGTRTLSGRNVGQSTTLQAGLFYIFHF